MESWRDAPAPASAGRVEEVSACPELLPAVPQPSQRSGLREHVLICSRQNDPGWLQEFKLFVSGNPAGLLPEANQGALQPCLARPHPRRVLSWQRQRSLGQPAGFETCSVCCQSSLNSVPKGDRGDRPCWHKCFFFWYYCYQHYFHFFNQGKLLADQSKDQPCASALSLQKYLKNTCRCGILESSLNWRESTFLMCH